MPGLQNQEGNTVSWFLIASIYYELQVFPAFTINRFAKHNMRIYYNTVQGRPAQLLDSQFSLICLEHNH